MQSRGFRRGIVDAEIRYLSVECNDELGNIVSNLVLTMFFSEILVVMDIFVVLNS